MIINKLLEDNMIVFVYNFKFFFLLLIMKEL